MQITNLLMFYNLTTDCTRNYLNFLGISKFTYFSQIFQKKWYYLEFFSIIIVNEILEICTREKVHILPIQVKFTYNLFIFILIYLQFIFHNNE